jgi:hypothetical protein
MMQSVLKRSQPIIVVDLFPEILKELISLMSSLSLGDWDEPTACPSWSVKDVALHLLGDDVAMLASGRDGHSSPARAVDWEELVVFINEWNEEWVRLSTDEAREQVTIKGDQSLGARVLDVVSIIA